MAWGAIGAALLGQGAGDASSGLASAAQYQASKHERNIAWKRAGQWELISPGLRMEGLRRAGLNPILAASGGFKGVQLQEPGMATTGGSPSFSRDAGSRAISTAKQAQMMDANVREAEARALMTEREAAAAEFLPERANFEAQGAQARWENLMETVRLLREQQGATSAQAERTRVQTQLDKSGLPSAKAVEELYQDYPWLRKAGAVLKDLTR